MSHSYGGVAVSGQPPAVPGASPSTGVHPPPVPASSSIPPPASGNPPSSMPGLSPPLPPFPIPIPASGPSFSNAVPAPLSSSIVASGPSPPGPIVAGMHPAAAQQSFTLRPPPPIPAYAQSSWHPGVSGLGLPPSMPGGSTPPPPGSGTTNVVSGAVPLPPISGTVQQPPSTPGVAAPPPAPGLGTLRERPGEVPRPSIQPTMLGAMTPSHVFASGPPSTVPTGALPWPSMPRGVQLPSMQSSMPSPGMPSTVPPVLGGGPQSIPATATPLAVSGSGTSSAVIPAPVPPLSIPGSLAPPLMPGAVLLPSMASVASSTSITRPYVPPPSVPITGLPGPSGQAVPVQVPGAMPTTLGGAPVGRPGPVPLLSSASTQFSTVRPLPSPRIGYSGNSARAPQIMPPGVLGSAPAGMIPRYSTPMFSPLVRPPTFPPRPPVGAPLQTVSTMPISRPPGTVLRPPVPPLLKFPPGMLPADVTKGVGLLATPEKPQTTVYVGKIASTVEDEFLRSVLELCGPIKSWKRAQDPTTGIPKGFGFCEFDSAEGVLRALRLLNKFSLEGQELVLNVNQATREYLERYVERKVENEKQLKEKAIQEAEEETAPGVESTEHKRPAAVDVLKSDHSQSEEGAEDNGKKFGIVNDAEKEADEEMLKRLTSMLEERARRKPLPPPPPLPTASESIGKSNSVSEAPAKSKDGDSMAEIGKDGPDGRNEDETTSENKASMEVERPETSSSDRGRRSERGRERDRERELKREKERELERYERERERERIRRERDREMRLRDAERLYEEREKMWEEREREKERQRLVDREREKERERDRRREIKDEEEESDDESWRKRRHRGDLYEERRKRRQREREDDEADRLKEEHEISEAKRQRMKETIIEETQPEPAQEKEMEVDEPTAIAIAEVDGCNKGLSVENSASPESYLEDERPQNLLLRNGTCNMVGDEEVQGASLTPEADGKADSTPLPRKVGFGLVGSGKRAVVPSLFHQEDEEESPTDRKLRPLVPIDYSAEEMQAVAGAKAFPSAGAAQNLAAAAEFAKSLSNAGKNASREDEFERDRGRRQRDRSTDKSYREREEDRGRERDRDRGRDDIKDKGRDREREKFKNQDKDQDKEHSLDRLKDPENKKLLDAKQLIDTIPKTKEELFGYNIDWSIYDKHDLHERMRPWISKKITEFLGEEITALVDFIVSNTRKHVTAAHMLELLESILDDEAEMFVLKMWRMLIFEIRKVETGLTSRP